jgi:hypothetical protein
VPDFLAEKRQEITARLTELKPQVDEYHRLEQAATALQSLPRTTASTATASAAPANGRKRARGRPRGARRKAATAATPNPATRKAGRPATKRRAGRRKGSGNRAIEAFALVQEKPGIQIPELATKMGIKQNYLYRVLPGLKQEGKVEKKGRGWHPKAKAKAAAAA